MATITNCTRTATMDEHGGADRTERTELLTLALRPWAVQTGRTPLLARTTNVRDLAAVARMLRRCSARSLLDRYQLGGRTPTAAMIDAELRNRFGFLVVTPTGDVVAAGSVRPDPAHSQRCGEISLLVEDRWQGVGVGSELLSHLAGVAHVAGFTELIAYPATAVRTAQRLMLDVGRTRMVPGVDAHLHTYLPESATLGLGSVRQQLAG